MLPRIELDALAMPLLMLSSRLRSPFDLPCEQLPAWVERLMADHPPFVFEGPQQVTPKGRARGIPLPLYSSTAAAAAAAAASLLTVPCPLCRASHAQSPPT